MFVFFLQENHCCNRLVVCARVRVSVRCNSLGLGTY